MKGKDDWRVERKNLHSLVRTTPVLDLHRTVTILSPTLELGNITISFFRLTVPLLFLRFCLL